MKPLFALSAAFLWCSLATAAELQVLGGAAGSPAQRMADDIAGLGAQGNLSITAVATEGTAANLRRIAAEPAAGTVAILPSAALNAADDGEWIRVYALGADAALVARPAYSKDQCYLLSDLVWLIDDHLAELSAAATGPWGQVEASAAGGPWDQGECFFRQASDGVDALEQQTGLNLKTQVALGIARNRLEKAKQAGLSNGGQYDWRAMKALEALQIARQRADR